VPRAVLALIFAVAACSSDSARTTCDGERLFGRPGASTGLDDSRCGPTCSCSGEPFMAPDYGAAAIDALLTWTLVEPYPALTSDPYAADAPDAPVDAACAVVVTGAREYRLETFPSIDDARAAGAIPTHAGACGVCSTLADLAVYMRYPDLTEPVRTCGLESGSQDRHLACLGALGFTGPCAQVWYYNTLHTRDRCLLPCLEALGEPYHQADGSLNACLVCDEVESGPVFKAVAGRTRRNTGVASAMCRPCSEVVPIVHVYE
jgi:hypothetical protein